MSAEEFLMVDVGCFAPEVVIGREAWSWPVQ